jgi:protein-serine/threonine kinase
LKDFYLRTVIGQGAYGTVSLVVKKDTQKLYAMKMLSKKVILAKN